MSNQNEMLDVTQLPDESAGLEAALRPATLDEFVGQEKLKDNLRIFIKAAKTRKEALDHCLFYAPPGLGKTTLANILAHEMGVNIKVTSGPVLARPGDLAAMLTTELAEGDILFIIEQQRYMANLSLAEAELAKAQSNLVKVEKDYKRHYRTQFHHIWIR